MAGLNFVLGMPVIQIDIRKGRTREQISELQRALTDAVVETIGAPREYVYVLVREEEGPNHAIAGKSLPDWKAGVITNSDAGRKDL
jgi:4-oxalocrotonate tautomerase family enzyme